MAFLQKVLLSTGLVECQILIWFSIPVIMYLLIHRFVIGVLRYVLSNFSI